MEFKYGFKLFLQPPIKLKYVVDKDQTRTHVCFSLDTL